MTNDRLYQMNPQGRFSDRAEDYAKYRPSYPAEAIDCILEGLGEPSQLIATDIGAGTGISSRLLAHRGVKVITIEPNAAMRQVAKAHPLVEFRDGSAENTKLPSNSVDLVTCFQSFHWFNPEPTLIEFARILKPEGRLAAVWNNRDRSDEFTAEYIHLTQTVSTIQSDWRTERFLRQTASFSTVTQLTFPYQQALDREGLIGRTMSTSLYPKQSK
ncbi:MAG: class I SAM-dependent methyltransferase [Xenococcaceae cyanobacterium MO_188.B32]|nr:class I SAM-dependent methyltransferase [Xenococcaceae cyanobacterium MO_188.B32]